MRRPTRLLVVSPYVVAELDSLVATRHGVDAELAALEELTGGAWELAGFGVEDLRRTRTLIAEYRDQDVGVAVASNVVLAERYHTCTIATLAGRTGGAVHPERERWRIGLAR